jgi:hypothetical protein
MRHKSPSPATLIRSSHSTTPPPPQYQQVPSPLSIVSQAKFPITVASCQFSTNTSPTSENLQMNKNNYSNDDTLLILGHDSLLPQDINWEDINNFDLDFEVASNNDADYTDDNYQRNQDEVRFLIFFLILNFY